MEELKNLKVGSEERILDRAMTEELHAGFCSAVVPHDFKHQSIPTLLYSHTLHHHQQSNSVLGKRKIESNTNTLKQPPKKVLRSNSSYLIEISINCKEEPKINKKLQLENGKTVQLIDKENFEIGLLDNQTLKFLGPDLQEKREQIQLTNSFVGSKIRYQRKEKTYHFLTNTSIMQILKKTGEIQINNIPLKEELENPKSILEILDKLFILYNDKIIMLVKTNISESTVIARLNNSSDSSIYFTDFIKIDKYNVLLIIDSIGNFYIKNLDDNENNNITRVNNPFGSEFIPNSMLQTEDGTILISTSFKFVEYLLRIDMSNKTYAVQPITEYILPDCTPTDFFMRGNKIYAIVSCCKALDNTQLKKRYRVH